MADATRDAAKLRVFISYSRADLAFADQLDATLKIGGFDTTLDRHGIHGGEAWQAQLEKLIRDADTVVFVLTPTSAVSQMCHWEVAKAGELAKRIVPVLPGPLGNQPAPAELAALNYIHFYPEPKKPGSGFGPGLEDLVGALKTDLDWLREHTRLLQRASEWDSGGRPENRLLMGASITETKAWAARRPKDAPQVTALHLDFLKASEEAETRRESVERKRLAEIEAAQKERAAALEVAAQATEAKIAASRQVVQRTRAGAIAALVLAGISTGLTVYAMHQRALADAAREQALVAAVLAQQQEKIAKDANVRADRFINLVSSNDAGKRAMDKICLEAVAVTSGLAKSLDASAIEAARDRFLELYYAPMYIVETHQRKYTGGSKIETAMFNFGETLKAAGDQAVPNPALCPLAKAVRDECVAYLNISAPEPCG
jgi:TIR domain